MAVSRTTQKWLLWLLITAVCVAVIAVAVHMSRAPEFRTGILFGYVDSMDRYPVRFYLTDDNGEAGITYAPYGYTPVEFKDVQIGDRHLEFIWPDTPAWICQLEFQRWHRVWQGYCQRPDGSKRFLQLGTRDKKPDLGQRLLASPRDIDILEYVLTTIPADEGNWNREDDRICDRSRLDDSWTLFCALHKATLDIAGEYIHWQPALHMVRRKIVLSAHDRIDHHILMDYNNHPDTTLVEIRERIYEAIDELNYQLEDETRLERVRIPFELIDG